MKKTGRSHKACTSFSRENLYSCLGSTISFRIEASIAPFKDKLSESIPRPKRHPLFKLLWSRSSCSIRWKYKSFWKSWLSSLLHPIPICLHIFLHLYLSFFLPFASKSIFERFSKFSILVYNARMFTLLNLEVGYVTFFSYWFLYMLCYELFNWLEDDHHCIKHKSVICRFSLFPSL